MLFDQLFARRCCVTKTHDCRTNSRSATAGINGRRRSSTAMARNEVFDRFSGRLVFKKRIVYKNILFPSDQVDQKRLSNGHALAPLSHIDHWRRHFQILYVYFYIKSPSWVFHEYQPRHQQQQKKGHTHRNGKNEMHRWLGFFDSLIAGKCREIRLRSFSWADFLTMAGVSIGSSRLAWYIGLDLFCQLKKNVYTLFSIGENHPPKVINAK